MSGDEPIFRGDPEHFQILRELDQRERRIIETMDQRMDRMLAHMGKTDEQVLALSRDIEHLTSRLDLNVARLVTIGRTLVFICVSIGGIATFFGALVVILGGFHGG